MSAAPAEPEPRLDWSIRTLRAIADRGRAELGESYPEIVMVWAALKRIAEAAQPSPTMADAKNMRALSAEAQARLESIRVPLPTAEERKAQGDAIERVRNKTLGAKPFGYVTKDTRGMQTFYKESPYLDTAVECVTVYDGHPEADAIVAKATLAAGEPTCYALRFPHDPRLNLSTVFDTEEEAKDYAERCDGVSVVPLYERAASSAGTPHGAREPSEDTKETNG